MTTIIERPEGSSDNSGGTVVIAVIVGALAAAVFGLYTFGAFDNRPAGTPTAVIVETPAAPAAAPAQSTPAPAPEAAPAPAPQAAPAPESEPAAPPAAPQ